MSCIITVSGKNIDIDALLHDTGMTAYCVWHEGDVLKQNEKHNNSGANILVSDADLDNFELQIEEATRFLERFSSAVSTLVSFPGVECSTLNFGIALPADAVARIDFLPARFIKAASLTGIEIQLSHYYCSDENEES